MQNTRLASILILVLSTSLISSCATTPKTEIQKRDISEARFLRVVSKGNPAKVKRLIEAGVHVNAHTKIWSTWSTTPLIIVSQRGHTEVAKLLIEAGADFNAWSHYDTALIVATNAGQTEIVKLLIERGALITTDEYGRTVLIISLKDGQTEIIELLIELLKEAGAEE